MSRILIGSSNVYRHYKPTAFKNHNEYGMIRCTDIESFAAQLDNLEPTETEVVISVLENFIEKAVSAEIAKMGPDDLVTIKFLKKETDILVARFLGMIEVAAKKNIGTKFVMIDPILRPKHDWYDEVLDHVKAVHKNTVVKMGLTNVAGADVISRASQLFEEDGVHLTGKSGRIFVGGILDSAEQIFQATFVDLENDDSADKEDEDHQHQQGPILTIRERVEKLERETEERRWNDNLLFARTREELDTAANKLKEDRVIMTGLTSTIPPPRDREQKKAWLKTLVMETMMRIKPDFDGVIGFLNQGKHNGKDIPMVEVKLNSIEAATGLRKAFAEKRKEGDGKIFGRLYVANSVSLSTRVRIDIMKAIAKKISNGNIKAHVAAYSSRPILHVRSEGESGGQNTSRAFTFIDSVIRYGSAVVQQDLEEAYRRAGTAFRGQIEQHFVVLRERENAYLRKPPPAGKTKKRGRESDDETMSTSKKA